jgi:hypothetical protein
VCINDDNDIPQDQPSTLTRNEDKYVRLFTILNLKSGDTNQQATGAQMRNAKVGSKPKTCSHTNSFITESEATYRERQHMQQSGAVLLIGPTVFRGKFYQVPRGRLSNSAAHHGKINEIPRS